jgi:hypothetical protein
LSSRLPAQVSSALAALLELSDNHAELLLGYLAFLTNILEYIEDFTSAQLMQVRSDATVVMLVPVPKHS